MATYLSVAKCIRNLSSNAKLNNYDVAVTVKYASMIATMVSKLQNKQDDYNIQSDIINAKRIMLEFYAT